jgi:hypothetical protein
LLEPELMDDAAQARAYAQADFAEENQGFVDRFREYFPDWAAVMSSIWGADRQIFRFVFSVPSRTRA